MDTSGCGSYDCCRCLSGTLVYFLIFLRLSLYTATYTHTQVLYDSLNPQSPRIMLPPSHNIENEPINIQIDSHGIHVSIYANYDCLIPGGQQTDVHLAVLTQINEELQFVDFKRSKKPSISRAARHERVDLTKSGSGRVLRLQLRTPGDTNNKKKTHKKRQRSNVDKVFLEKLSDKTAAVFSDVASNIFHVNNLSGHKVRDNMSVGMSLFKRGSRSMKSQSRIRIMPNFLSGASMLELTQSDCQSHSKKVLSFTVNVRSVIYLLIAHVESREAIRRACPEWLQNRFFLRDEHVHLMQPIGSSEGIQIWQLEKEIEEGARFSIPGLGGFGGPMVVAIARSRQNRPHYSRRRGEKEEDDDDGEIYDDSYVVLRSKDDDEEEKDYDDYDSAEDSVVVTSESPGRILLGKALGH
jgi:hypothetical protein